MVPVVMTNIHTHNWYIGSINHRSRDGYWAIDIPGEEQALATEDFTLSTLRVQSDEGIFNVDPKQWDKVMNQVGRLVVFSVKPLTYRTGLYHQECSVCGKDFTGGKLQSICESCCNERGTARVLTKEYRTPVNKPPRFTKQQLEVVNQFIKEHAPEEGFESWLKKRYGSNSAKC